MMPIWWCVTFDFSLLCWINTVFLLHICVLKLWTFLPHHTKDTVQITIVSLQQWWIRKPTRLVHVKHFFRNTFLLTRLSDNWSNLNIAKAKSCYLTLYLPTALCCGEPLLDSTPAASFSAATITAIKLNTLQWFSRTLHFANYIIFLHIIMMINTHR